MKAARLAIRPVFVVLAVSAGVLLATSLPAQGANPVLDFLQNVIDPKLDSIEDKLDHSARVAVVTASFTTSPGATTIQNIDVAGSLLFGKIKRYTLTINPGTLVTAAPGADSIEVIVGVLDAGTAYDVMVFNQDTATMSALPFPGTSVPPYAGTNSFIRVVRGADGLGAVVVRINAYVELEP